MAGAVQTVRPRVIDLTTLLFLLLLYLSVSLRHLTIVPPVYEDEPWQASTGWKIATEGVFGTDLFAGFYGMERHYYGYMPLHPLLLAAIYRVAGVGLFQTRLEPVLMGLLTLILTYSLALRLFKDARIGWLAVLFLLTVRLSGLTAFQLTGILLLDMARIARYDMVVPVFGLAALHAYITARGRDSRGWFLLSGLLAALSALAHVYGLFWLPALILLALWDRRSRAEIAAIALGFVLPLLPYIAYVLSELHDWRGQTRQYGNRFDLLNPTWYWRNLMAEYRRYGPGLGSLRSAALRVGFWSALVVLPASLIALAWRALRRQDSAARAIVVPLVVFPALFALLIHSKLVNYTVSFLPLAAMAAAWGSVTVWDRVKSVRHARWVRLALALWLAAIIVEGARRIVVLEVAAKTTTPYYAYINRVRQHIPPGARVLGLQNYWFGLEEFDYRSFALPLWQTDPAYEPRPLSFEEALEQVAPEVVLIDQRMRHYFATSGAAVAQQFDRWLKRHHGQLIGRVDDATYGVMEIYRLN